MASYLAIHNKNSEEREQGAGEGEGGREGEGREDVDGDVPAVGNKDDRGVEEEGAGRTAWRFSCFPLLCVAVCYSLACWRISFALLCSFKQRQVLATLPNCPKLNSFVTE